MSNVIVFPKAKRGTPANNIEEILENVEMARREQIELIIDKTLSYVFECCYQEGFDLMENKCLKSTAMVVESLRAALYNTAKMEHSLHDVAEKMFVSEQEAAAQTERILTDDSEFDFD